MWVVTKERKPEQDGFYLVQLMYGDVNGLSYTTDGGWNTHYDRFGNLQNKSAIADYKVARWFDAPEPPEIPDKCFLEMQKVRMAHEV